MQQYSDSKQKIDEIYKDTDFKELINAGVFLGRKKTKTYPRMRPFILVSRNDFEVINLNKTLEKMNEAVEFLKKQVKEGKQLLFVGTQIASESLLMDINKELNLPVVTNRWIGGLLTNFDVVLKRINFFKKLREDIQSGALEKYTKKERLKINKQFEKLEKLFGGLENLSDLPGVLIIIDPNLHINAIREAKKLNIPVIAFINTDGNPELVDIFVPGNTRSKLSINWFLNNIKKAYLEARNTKSNESSQNEIENN
ncbi:MAG: 30S ribosomal protein S2 [Patescibacteria group bacterium]|nr:30S ribosomal protein S2 [Patescibacteria group bacterium]MCX7589589.1 30S ribosomal protein S2 [Patescibacteria group bacterium]MDW8279853.1 30S ribosomal protein S2 [bacterium]